MDEEPESLPWSAPGLLRRVEEGRRYRPQPKVRKTLRQRLAERGLHWNTTIVVGMFIAVTIAALTAVLVGTAGSGGLPGDNRARASDGSGFSGPLPQSTPTPALCFVGEQSRPCH
jgi:hypothetical protein